MAGRRGRWRHRGGAALAMRRIGAIAWPAR
jgi:hypothetical protein